MLHFSVEKKHTSKFTYRLLKSSVYIINQIWDLTNSYDMPRSRSQWLFLEKNIFHCSISFIHGSILIKLPTNVKYDNILMNFEFEGSRAKVKVTVAIFRKALSLL